MAVHEHIVSVYEDSLKELAKGLIEDKDPSDEDVGHVALLSELVQALVRTYKEYTKPSELNASTSAMYAMGGNEERRVLNLPLRILVDYNSLTAWHARFLNASMGTKRSIIVTGEESVGKSTLINALIDLLPRDQRIVFIDEAEDSLPILRGRSFTVQLKAQPGTQQRSATFRKAMDMKPNWLVVGELTEQDSSVFFKALSTGVSGLTTVRTSDPEYVVNELMTLDEDIIADLARVDVVLAHMVRDGNGRPVLDKIFEVTTLKGKLEMIPRQPSENKSLKR